MSDYEKRMGQALIMLNILQDSFAQTFDALCQCDDVESSYRYNRMLENITRERGLIQGWMASQIRDVNESHERP